MEHSVPIFPLQINWEDDTVTASTNFGVNRCLAQSQSCETWPLDLSDKRRDMAEATDADQGPACHIFHSSIQI